MSMPMGAEIVAWLFALPMAFWHSWFWLGFGIMVSALRASTRRTVCPRCGSEELVPPDVQV